MITAAQVRATISAFETTILPPMSNAWDDVRRTMQEAIQQYAAQEGLTIAEAVKAIEVDAS